MGDISDETLGALEACGRDRVMHNDGSPPMVAIRWDRSDEQGRPVTEWIVGRPEGTAEGRDSAARKAAAEFVRRLRVVGESYLAWAQRIETALNRRSGGNRG